MICRWAVVWTGSPDTAEDIAQTVLLRVRASLASFAPESHVTTWVYRITKHALIDHDRSGGREDALHDRFRLGQLTRALAEEHGDRAFEAADLLWHLMAALSPQQRAALDLVDLQGYATQEAAEMLEVAPATLRVHLHRARQALRAQVDGGESLEVTNG